MKPVAPKPQRCAIYTRKSTEHNLDLAFNSLDAQREACEASLCEKPPSGPKWIHEIKYDGYRTADVALSCRRLTDGGSLFQYAGRE